MSTHAPIVFVLIALLSGSGCYHGDSSANEKPSESSSNEPQAAPGADAGFAAASRDPSVENTLPAVPECADCEMLATRYVAQLRMSPSGFKALAPQCVVVLDAGDSFCDCGVDDTMGSTDGCAYPSLRTGRCFQEEWIEDCERRGTQADAWCRAQCATIREAAFVEGDRTFEATLRGTRCLVGQCAAAVNLDGACHQVQLTERANNALVAVPLYDGCGASLCDDRQKCTIVQ